MRIHYLIVGAGFAGCTLAERIATQLNKRVMLIEKRHHIGGNAYDYFNEDGILVQKYGPHIFHSNSRVVWEYLSQYTEWNEYVHRVIAKVNGKGVFLPINLVTMEQLYDREFTTKSLCRFLEKRRCRIDKIVNARDVVVSQVGEELYDLFFKNYTKKQWGVYPEELDPQVAQRFPLRLNRDTRYFTDKYQGIPKDGYTKMFEKMLDNSTIDLILGVDFRAIVDSITFDNLIFTGPIDYFFDYVLGKLPYRSLTFELETLNMEQYQDVAVVNYPTDYDFTRITEFKHFYYQKNTKTTICREYPQAEGDPYYPIPNPESQNLYHQYKLKAEKQQGVHFVGRLAQYSYLDMDQVVLLALQLFKKISRNV